MTRAKNLSCIATLIKIIFFLAATRGHVAIEFLRKNDSISLYTRDRLAKLAVVVVVSLQARASAKRLLLYGSCAKKNQRKEEELNESVRNSLLRNVIPRVLRTLAEAGKRRTDY